MPKTAPRKAYHHGNLREEALSAAEAFVEADGADALTLRELGNRLGVSHRALYRHFADRETLLAEVATKTLQAMREAMTAAADKAAPTSAVTAPTSAVTAPTSAIMDKSALARVQSAMDAYVRYALAHPHAYQNAMHAGVAKKSASSSLREAGRALGVDFAELYAAAVPAHSDTRRNDSIAIWGILHGLVDLYLGGTLRAKNRDVARAYILDLAFTHHLHPAPDTGR